MAVIPLSFGLFGGGSDEVTATRAQVLTGYTAITADSADEPIEGTIPIKSGQTYYPTLSNQNIAQGQYLDGIQVINKITPSNIKAGNIKAGTTVKVNNGNADIINVTGTYSTPSSGQNPIVSSKVLTGYSGFVNGGAEVKGNIPLKQAQTYNVSGSDQSITAGQYLNGAQTFRGVTTSNIDAGNIKKGVNVKVGDSANTGRIKNVTGTYSTPSSGQSPVTANKMLSGYSGFVNGGSEVKGSIPSKSAATYNTSTSDQSIASGQYLSGAQTIKAVTTSNISAGNIKKGVNIKVGDANSAGRIANVTGTYTTPSSGQNPVTAGAMLSGYSGFVNGGGEVKGTIVNRGQAQYGGFGEGDDYYAINSMPEGAYFSNGASWAPEGRCSKKTVRDYLGVSAGKIAKGESIAGVTGTWYGNKATIGVSAYDRDSDHNDKYNEQSFTMPASGRVYYGGCSGGRYFNLIDTNATCAIYKNGSVMDNRNISNGNYPFRGTMFNKSFSANAGDVIKVVASCEQGSTGNFIMSCIQAVIVY